MAAFALMAMMMAASDLPAAPIDFDLGDRGAAAGPAEGVPGVRLTRTAPRRSRYLPPRLESVETDETPARLRWRGRKIKLRVPVGPGS